MDENTNYLRLFEQPALAEGKISDRKRRLFAVACVKRRVCQGLVDPRALRAIGVAERYACGLASEKERREAEDDAFEAFAEMREGRFGGETLVPWTWSAEQLTRAAALTVSLGHYYAEDVADYSRRALGQGWEAEQAEERAQCELLHEICGPEETAFLDPWWRVANEGAVVQLARCIESEQAFELMPVLGDALEEAGCTDGRILRHCRGGGPHCRGCWVVDWVLEQG